MQKMIILGSGSPRRAEILSFFDLPFEVITSDCDESAVPQVKDPKAYATAIAVAKAKSFPKDEERLIVTADTVVEKEGVYLGKPKDEEHAFEMLKQLNGKWHTVYSAVCAYQRGKLHSAVGVTRILFHQATEAQLRAYHHCFHGRDKAGGYGVQEGGSILVKKIEGCFYNVMGLPISELVEVLAKFDLDLWQHLKQS